MYGNVMRERSASAAVGTVKLRFKASHHRKVAPLRVSHHGGAAWEPQMKDADREEQPTRRKKK